MAATSSLLNRVRGYLDVQFEVDARSLAAGRIGVALLLLYDLGLRATDLRAHYSDEGVLPRALFTPSDWLFSWSLHSLSGSTAFEAVLFAAATIAGLSLLLGFQTRAATLVSFVLATSLHGRNPFLRDGQDDLMRVLLFFCLWLPWGRRWSWDSMRTPATNDRVSGVHGSGLFCQMALMYGSSAVGKLQSGWWKAGHGVLRALQLGRYETHLGQWFTQFPALLRQVGWMVIAVEIALPLLLLLPFRSRWPRLLAIALGMGLHLSFWIFMRLGIFPFLCVAMWSMLLPASLWERFAPGTRAGAPADSNPTSLRPAVLALPFLLVSLLYVVETHGTRPLFPSWFHRSVEAIGLQQYWIVFSPRNAATMSDGFFVAPGLRADGQTVDLFADDGPVTWQRPELVSSSFGDTRWRHYYANIAIEWPRGTRQQHDMIAIREATADYLCDDYARRHPDGPRLTHASLYLAEHPMEKPDQPPVHRLIAQVACR